LMDTDMEIKSAPPTDPNVVKNSSFVLDFITLLITSKLFIFYKIYILTAKMFFKNVYKTKYML
jgi:hypothetical protein